MSVSSSLNAPSQKFFIFREIFHFGPFLHESVPRGIRQPIRTLRSPEAPRGRARTPPGARAGWRVRRSDASVPRQRRADIRVGAPPRSRRSRASGSLCDFFRARVFVYTTCSFSHATDTSAPSRADDARGARGAFRARRATRGVHRNVRRDHPRRRRAPRAPDPAATMGVTFLARMGSLRT